MTTPLTPRERATVALTGDHLFQPDFVVARVEAAIDLAMRDENSACEQIAAEVSATNEPALGTRETEYQRGAVQAAATIQARILERAKRWPENGARL